ncbi:SRPBCC family protein [Georgenia deserti]|uniref:SRPBCC family protein n=1 Tax=Georgenia deserti TaxID=2093781 RepID=A0ABW4LA67_9MICO
MSDSTATAGTVIDAPIEHVREALLSATLLPEWNPAFVKVEGTPRAVAGAEYRLETIRGLRGALTYTYIDGEAITISWRVTGLSETGEWQLTRLDASRQTRVTHAVERDGPLALLLGHTLGTLPSLRLERLAQRVSGS